MPLGSFVHQGQGEAQHCQEVQFMADDPAGHRPASRRPFMTWSQWAHSSTPCSIQATLDFSRHLFPPRALVLPGLCMLTLSLAGELLFMAQNPARVSPPLDPSHLFQQSVTLTGYRHYLPYV